MSGVFFKSWQRSAFNPDFEEESVWRLWLSERLSVFFFRLFQTGWLLPNSDKSIRYGNPVTSSEANNSGLAERGWPVVSIFILSSLLERILTLCPRAVVGRWQCRKIELDGLSSMVHSSPFIIRAASWLITIYNEKTYIWSYMYTYKWVSINARNSWIWNAFSRSFRDPRIIGLDWWLSLWTTEAGTVQSLVQPLPYGMNQWSAMKLRKTPHVFSFLRMYALWVGSC